MLTCWFGSETGSSYSGARRKRGGHIYVNIDSEKGWVELIVWHREKLKLRSPTPNTPLDILSNLGKYQFYQFLSRLQSGIKSAWSLTL